MATIPSVQTTGLQTTVRYGNSNKDSSMVIPGLMRQ
jgi:hypothetical protein